ncbi:hypothetical protein TNCV_4391001 [Trichonephila clavipes]|nr:hypothetical protein TNCV_4391001 [Trichonephila clavipes]
MIVQFRNEKVSNHRSIPITIDCNVVAFIVFEEGFHQPIKRTKQKHPIFTRVGKELHEHKKLTPIVCVRDYWTYNFQPSPTHREKHPTKHLFWRNALIKTLDEWLLAGRKNPIPTHRGKAPIHFLFSLHLLATLKALITFFFRKIEKSMEDINPSVTRSPKYYTINLRLGALRKSSIHRRVISLRCIASNLRLKMS